MVESAGPARWRSALAPARIGKLAADPQGRTIADRVRLLARVAPSAVDLEALLGDVLAYRGTIRAVVEWVDAAGEAPGGLVLTVRVLSDGNTDLARWVESTSQLLVEWAGDASDPGSRGGFLRPRLERGAMVLRAGWPRSTAVAAGDAQPTSSPVLAAGEDTVLAARIDVPNLLVGLAALGCSPSAATMRWTGLGSIDSARFGVRRLGEHLVVDGELAFGAGPRGWFGLRGRDATAAPRLLHVVPTDVLLWGVHSLRFDRLAEQIDRELALCRVADPTAPSLTALGTMLNDRTGLDLKADVIAPLGDAFALAVDRTGMTELLAGRSPNGLSLAVPTPGGARVLTDLRSALGTSLEPMRTTAGATLYRSRGASVAFSISDSIGVLGVGSTGVERAAAGLLAEWPLAGERGAPGLPPDLPPGVAQRLELAPGWDTLWRIGVPSVLEIASAGEEVPAGICSAIGRAARAIRAVGLTDLVACSGWREDRWWARLVW